MPASEDQNIQTGPQDDSELEQYGVWVKAGPEDVDDSDDDAFGLADLGEDELEEADHDLLAVSTDTDTLEVDSPPEEAFSLDDIASDETLTDDGLTLDDEDSLSLDIPEMDSDDVETESEPAIDELELDSLQLDGDDDFADISLDDAASVEADDAPLELTLDDAPELEEAGSDLPSAPDGDDLLSLDDDDLESPSDDMEELGLDTTIELDVAEPLDAEPVDGLGEHDIDLGAVTDSNEELEPLEEAEASGGSGIDIEDSLPGDANDLALDLNELDVDAFEEPTEGQAEEPIEEALGSDELEEAESLDLTLDDSDDADLDALDLDGDAEVAELDLSSLPEGEDEFEALSEDDITDQPDDELPELEQDDELDLDMSFDDVAAVEDDLTAPLEESSAADTAAINDMFDDEPSAPAADARSLSLLESIERELTSIRTELSELKGELATLRTDAPASADPLVATDEEPAAGFFDDDDDETIALTGDELDNIMNTAEFTEETGQPTEPDFEESLGDQPVQEITLEDAQEEADPIDLTLDDDLSLDEDDLSLRGDDLSLREDVSIDVETPTSDDLLVGSDDAVEELASLDIDAELADVPELDDDSAITESSEPLDLAPEPLEAEPLDEEPLEALDADPIDELEADPIELDVEDVEPEPVAAEESEAEFDLDALDAEPLPQADEILDDDPTTEALTEEEQSLLVGEDALETGLPPVDDEPVAAAAAIDQIPTDEDTPIPENLRGELRSVLNYMDKLLDSLPEAKIQEFASSDHFKVYRRLFEELGLEEE